MIFACLQDHTGDINQGLQRQPNEDRVRLHSRGKSGILRANTPTFFWVHLSRHAHTDFIGHVFFFWRVWIRERSRYVIYSFGGGNSRPMFHKWHMLREKKKKEKKKVVRRDAYPDSLVACDLHFALPHLRQNSKHIPPVIHANILNDWPRALP